MIKPYRKHLLTSPSRNGLPASQQAKGMGVFMTTILKTAYYSIENYNILSAQLPHHPTN